jgi:hypothetical protein
LLQTKEGYELFEYVVGLVSALTVKEALAS